MSLSFFKAFLKHDLKSGTKKTRISNLVSKYLKPILNQKILRAIFNDSKILPL
jgi:hypothetical protein